MQLHPQDKQAISLIGVMAMVGHLVLAAICGGPLGGVQQITSDGGAFVIICSPAGNQRIALDDYLAGVRSGEPVQNSGGSYCAHCSMGSAFALGALALFLLGIGWPRLRTTRSSVAARVLSAVRTISVRGPPPAFA